jgi:hypothetical protein
MSTITLSNISYRPLLGRHGTEPVSDLRATVTDGHQSERNNHEVLRRHGVVLDDFRGRDEQSPVTIATLYRLNAMDSVLAPVPGAARTFWS